MRRFIFLILIAMLVVFLARPAFATLSACAGAMTSYPAGNNPPSGCGQVDLGFSGFGSTGTPSSNVNVDPSGGFPSGPQSQNLSNLVLDFNSGAYIVNTASTKNFTTTNTVQVFDAAQGGQSPPAPYSTWAITSLAAGPGASAFTNTSDSITMVNYFCLNTLATCSTGTADGELDSSDTTNGTQTLLSTNYCLYVTAGNASSGCSATGTYQSPLQLPTPVYEMSFFTTLAIHDAGGAGSSLSGDIEITFDQTAETPEPATFALMGSALLLLLLGRRLRDRLRQN